MTTILALMKRLREVGEIPLCVIVSEQRLQKITKDEHIPTMRQVFRIQIQNCEVIIDNSAGDTITLVAESGKEVSACAV